MSKQDVPASIGSGNWHDCVRPSHTNGFSPGRVEQCAHCVRASLQREVTFRTAVGLAGSAAAFFAGAIFGLLLAGWIA